MLFLYILSKFILVFDPLEVFETLYTKKILIRLKSFVKSQNLAIDIIYLDIKSKMMFMLSDLHESKTSAIATRRKCLLLDKEF